ncbi:MAG: hypothetical protein M0Q94_11805 [Candidatus Cloacimonetes bacterium]|nr:hypothetical protein [Candidatus Cloacimonadota bacterium]
MEKKDYLIIAIISIITLTISLYNVFEPDKILLGETYKEMYGALDNNINIIETNMKEITVDSDDWQELKELNIKDEKQKNTYNSLILDIKKCYLLSNDIKNKTYDNIKIMSFKNKEYANKYEILKLNKNEICLKEFDKYNSMVLSDNKDLSERLKTQINIIIDYKEESDVYKSFYELLSFEAVNMSKIASLSKWLKIEYNTYKL